MIRVIGKYRDQKLELASPLNLPEGTEVEIHVHVSEDLDSEERRGWESLAVERLEQAWDNPDDAIYDDWKRLYGV